MFIMDCIVIHSFLFIIGERAKRARHYQGCTNLRNCVCILCIYMYVKHNSSSGTHIEILELLTTFLLFSSSLSKICQIDYFCYFCKSFQDNKLPERVV